MTKRHNHIFGVVPILKPLQHEHNHTASAIDAAGTARLYQFSTEKNGGHRNSYYNLYVHILQAMLSS